jgi:hypothetical protein
MAGESLEQSGSVELDAVPNRLAAARRPARARAALLHPSLAKTSRRAASGKPRKCRRRLRRQAPRGLLADRENEPRTQTDRELLEHGRERVEWSNGRLAGNDRSGARQQFREPRLGGASGYVR